MTPPSAVQQLLQHIDLLRVQHRAGITPPSGHVEQLFDLVANAKVELATMPAASTAAAQPCASAVTHLLLEVVDDTGRSFTLKVPLQTSALDAVPAERRVTEP